MLKESFINRGFNETFLDTEFQRLSEIEWNTLLAPKSKGKDLNGIPFVLTYNQTILNVKQIINKHWYLLHKFRSKDGFPLGEVTGNLAAKSWLNYFATKLYLIFTWITLAWSLLKINHTLTTILQH